MNRRDFLVTGGALGATLGMASGPSHATTEDVQKAISALVGKSPITKGRVTLELAPLVENGNTVPLAVDVESPMTAADHVKAIHIFAEKNPQPFVVVFRFGPRAGRARVATRIRLADSQTVRAICEMSDGSFWSGSADAVVTLASCSETV